MKEKLEELKEIISNKLNDEHIIVCDVTYNLENGYNVLQVVLDKVNGIDLDTIVMASNIINPIVDKFDITDDLYILDVISKEKGDNNG